MVVSISPNPDGGGHGDDIIWDLNIPQIGKMTITREGQQIKS